MPKVVLERQEKIKALAFGYMHKDPNDLFFPVAVATSEQSIYIYRDDVANDFNGDSYSYKIRKLINHDDIDFIYHETYRSNLEYRDYGRISIIFKNNKEENLDICYRKEDKVEILGLLKELRGYGVKTKHRSINKKPLFLIY